MIRLGSLFDGIGGFPLAGQRAGITPVWASEIEAFPVSITMRHFPHMQHLGDVTAINGAELDPVDVITFGSPCQDLSAAGKRRGLHGERSSLFHQALRIVHEMRRATNGRYPILALWENVPGAFSTNGGRDFEAVLRSLADCGAVDVAWRVLDAQYFGLAQRRRRVFTLADFGGERAAEILFEPESLSWNSAKGSGTGKASTRAIAGGAGEGRLAGTLMASAAGLSRTAGIASETDFLVPVVAKCLTTYTGRASDGTMETLVPLCEGEGSAYQVRRLTPLECERLQGFPDGWTKGGSDTARYKAIGNSIAVPCVEWIMRRISWALGLAV